MNQANSKHDLIQIIDENIQYNLTTLLELDECMKDDNPFKGRLLEFTRNDISIMLKIKERVECN